MNINITLLYQMAFFVIFVWFSKKFVWSPIIGALNARRETIADGLAAAEKGQLAEAKGREQAEQVVRAAKSQAGDIIGRAEKHGAELVERAREDAKREGERILQAARAQIQTETGKAKDALRGQVGALAVAGAEQILQREVDAKTHADLLGRLATQL